MLNTIYIDKSYFEKIFIVKDDVLYAIDIDYNNPIDLNYIEDSADKVAKFVHYKRNIDGKEIDCIDWMTLSDYSNYTSEDWNDKRIEEIIEEIMNY